MTDHTPAALDTWYEFLIVNEDENEIAAEGMSYFYDIALKEGQRYLLECSQKGKHTLTVTRKEILFVNTIHQ
jgi:hypothetical protein